MVVEPRAAGGGLGIAGTDCEAIVDGLNPRGGDLGVKSELACWSRVRLRRQVKHGMLRYRDNSDDAYIGEEGPPYNGQELRHDIS